VVASDLSDTLQSERRVVGNIENAGCEPLLMERDYSVDRANARVVGTKEVPGLYSLELTWNDHVSKDRPASKHGLSDS